MNQRTTWYGRRRRSIQHCVKWGCSSPSQKRDRASYFRPMYIVAWPNGCMDKHASWHGGRSRRRPYCARGGTSCPSQKTDTAQSFGRTTVVTKWLHGSRCHLVGRWPRSKQHCVTWTGDLAPIPKKGAEPTNFRSCLLWLNSWMDEDAT